MRRVLSALIALIGVAGILAPKIRYPDTLLTGTISISMFLALVVLAVGLWFRNPIGWFGGHVALILGATYTMAKTCEIIFYHEMPTSIRVIFIAITSLGLVGVFAFWVPLWKRARSVFQPTNPPG
jgi:hypothetical protein